MLKRKSVWFGGSASLLLVLSMSGIVAGAEDLTPPDAAPVVVDTTATFEDIDANGIDDDCQTEAAVAADAATVAAAEAAVDTNADGVISTTEAAQSPRIGGKNCNQGGYVSWIAHQKHACTVEPTETVEPTVGETVELVVSEPTDEDTDGDEPEVTEPDADACDTAIDGAKKDKFTAAAARAASKAERALVRAAAKAERTLAHETSKAERTAAKAAAKAERAAAKAANKAAHAAKAKGH